MLLAQLEPPESEVREPTPHGKVNVTGSTGATRIRSKVGGPAPAAKSNVTGSAGATRI